jgi:tetratricopeptide (TPR) repeat protein
VLDPLSLLIHSRLGILFYLSRDYEAAIKQFEKVFELDQNFLIARHWLALSYAQKGLYKEAIAELQTVDLSGGYTWPLASLGCIYGMCGQNQEAERVIQKLKKASDRKYICAYDIAFVYSGLGDKDHAFEWLESAYNERFMLLVWLNAEPVFDPLRSDPRSQDLLRRIGLSQGLEEEYG